MEFESEENCKAAKEAMQGCEIDGSKVTVAYAKPKGEQTAKGGKAGAPGRKAASRSRDRSDSKAGNWFIKEMAVNDELNDGEGL